MHHVHQSLCGMPIASCKRSMQLWVGLQIMYNIDTIDILSPIYRYFILVLSLLLTLQCSTRYIWHAQYQFLQITLLDTSCSHVAFHFYTFPPFLTWPIFSPSPKPCHKQPTSATLKPYWYPPLFPFLQYPLFKVSMVCYVFLNDSY